MKPLVTFLFYCFSWLISLLYLVRKIYQVRKNDTSANFTGQQALLERVDHDLLWQQVCNELFERDYNTIKETIEEYRKSKRK